MLCIMQLPLPLPIHLVFSQISINLEYHFINGADTRASFSKSRLMDVRCHIVTLWFGLLAANIFLKYMCP